MKGIVMKVPSLAALLASAWLGAAGLAGCGDAHLGDAYGRRTRSAFDTQAQAKGGDSAGTLDSDDAKVTLARQRGRALPGTPGANAAAQGTSGYGGMPYPTMGGTSSSGMTSAGIPSSSPGGPIRLDAVR